MTALPDLPALPPADVPVDPARGDAYNNREYLVRQHAPEVAGWLQAGRPRREVSTTGYLLVVRERLLRLTRTHLRLMAALLDLAEAHLETLMPDYTYLQTAHPTTLAHYLLTFVQPITRDLDRLRSVFERTNLSPAGSGSTNGSRLPLNRERLADLLGFDGLVLHTRDAMWQPDAPIEVLSTLVALLANVDRLAEDWQLWATSEFGLIELADRHSRISVIMPQKKNPYSLTFIRGVAREMPGRLVSVAAQQMTPSGQVDNRIFAYGSVPHSLEQTRQAVQLLADTAAGLTVHADQMAHRAAQSHSGATDLAEAIMLLAGIDANTAHRIVGQAVRAALTTAQPLTMVLLDEAATDIICRSLDLTQAQIDAITDPAAIVATRTGPGGAASSSVQTMLDIYWDALVSTETWLSETEQRLTEANKQLLTQAHALAA
jgi:argininosuccinate lyase